MAAFYSAPEASPIMQRETSPPKLHEYDAYYLLGELDMVALSGLYRQWALYEINFPPDKRTRLMAWSAGLERLLSGLERNGVRPILRRKCHFSCSLPDGCASTTTSFSLDTQSIGLDEFNLSC